MHFHHRPLQIFVHMLSLVFIDSYELIGQQDHRRVCPYSVNIMASWH